MKNIIVVLTFMCMMLSCSETVISHSSISLPLTEAAGEFAFKDCFAPVEFIPLQEAPDFHIGTVIKVEYFNDEYYVCCENSSKYQLVVFDKQGKKVREIGCFGNGHGEHGRIRDFCVDKINHRVILLCDNSVVMVYSLSGEFSLQKRLSRSVFENIASLDGYILCTTNHHTYREGDDAFLFYIFDEKFSLLAKHTPVLPDYMGMPSLQTAKLKTQDNHYVYSDFYQHKIYVMDAQGEILQIYNYDKPKLMSSELFKDYDLFTENQFKYDFIFDNVMIKDTIVSIYKSGQQVRVSINTLDGSVRKDGLLKSYKPKLNAVCGDNILSVCTIEDLERMGLNEYSDKSSPFFYIVKYKLLN